MTAPFGALVSVAGSSTGGSGGGGGAPGSGVAVPAIGVIVSVAGVSSGGGGGTPPDPTPVNPLTVTLSSPDDQSTVAISAPTFIVGVDTSLEDPRSSYTLHLQYASGSTFTSATELTANFTAIDAGAFLTPTGALPATTYWRARVAQGDTWRSAWSDPQSFTVSSSADPSSVPVTWTVSSNATVGRYPHLWHILPAAAYPGDRVTIYGDGFSDSQGTVWLGTVRCTVNSWTFVPQPANPDDSRHITGADITAEHYEVVITVPSYNPPGGPLEVTS